jgi:hypothetical protein
MASHTLSDRHLRALQYIPHRTTNPTTRSGIASQTANPTSLKQLAEINHEIATLKNVCQSTLDGDRKLELYTQLLFRYHSYFLVFQELSNLDQQELPHNQDQLWLECIQPGLDLPLHGHTSPSPRSMLRFIENASSTLSELLKEVPRKELTWTTYLGHLYSKGSVVAESQDRDKYGEIGRLWYSKACEIDPTEGSIYLCLALHSTNILQKHFLRKLSALSSHIHVVKACSRHSLTRKAYLRLSLHSSDSMAQCRQ